MWESCVRTALAASDDVQQIYEDQRIASEQEQARLRSPAD